jgi:hypothetical protein
MPPVTCPSLPFCAWLPACAQQVLEARSCLVDLWSELALASPSLRRLDALGQAIQGAIRKAEGTFKRLLRLNPTSVPVLRRYTLFLAEVRHCGALGGAQAATWLGWMRWLALCVRAALAARLYRLFYTVITRACALCAALKPCAA